MNLYIYNDERNLLGIVEAYEYLRWTRRYHSCGSFELKAIANDINIALLQNGNIIWKNDDDEAGIIEFVEMVMQDREYITVSGRFATGFLARRIVWNTETLNGDIFACVAQLLNNHIIAPTDPNRKIDGVTFTPTTLNKPINTQISYRNMMDSITNLCETTDVGIKTVFDPTSGTFDVQLYIGSDSQAVFSTEYENIIEQVFTQSGFDYTNTALVGGSGEGSDRTFITVGDSTGTDRYEMFVDAKDLRSADFPDNYTEALIFRGNTRLSEHALVKSFDVTVNQYGNLKYKVDFDLGSNIQAVSKKWGVSMQTRITEVTESYDRDGLSIDLTFGKPLFMLADKLDSNV